MISIITFYIVYHVAFKMWRVRVFFSKCNKDQNIQKHEIKLYIISSLYLQPYCPSCHITCHTYSRKLVCGRKPKTHSRFKNTTKFVLLLWLQLVFVYFVLPQCLTTPNSFLRLRLCSGTQLSHMIDKFWDKQGGYYNIPRCLCNFHGLLVPVEFGVCGESSPCLAPKAVFMA